MTAPKLGPEDFFALATKTGIEAVEIRNDLEGNAILDGTFPDRIKALASAARVRIVSINALQRFNAWSPAREAEAIELADYAQACGAQALVLVPKNDGTGVEESERLPNLKEALAGLAPILQARGLIGLVEPLGFECCSLRLKSEAVAGIEATAGREVFKLVHDTFHHHLAGETAIFPEQTGLVHISGVTDPSLAVADMKDEHRVLVDATDRLGNVEQIVALDRAGYQGLYSFEPFAREVHELSDLQGAIEYSIEFINEGLQRQSV
ncbi:TIM barrel protein [Jiella sp. MQZ9-1]|uniref:TIM barrel protein n=1 Tax=Jiella flava TaxID=2816857 RepID=A0A939G393_9HYPH|nr:TIM barrel protein [Jiella flava]MBO0664274.1 TIM barrel protein [Jiella flava]MCD2472803.1 TIM barrel protein [Jiella flava]